jgi:hypothetical protein
MLMVAAPPFMPALTPAPHHRDAGSRHPLFVPVTPLPTTPTADASVGVDVHPLAGSSRADAKPEQAPASAAPAGGRPSGLPPHGGMDASASASAAGSAPPALFAMLAGLLVVLAVGCFSRLRIAPVAWRPVALVSLNTRPD